MPPSRPPRFDRDYRIVLGLLELITTLECSLSSCPPSTITIQTYQQYTKLCAQVVADVTGERRRRCRAPAIVILFW
jgi:hypothetical protein